MSAARHRREARLPAPERRERARLLRFRHTDSDFYRTARQQTFLHAFEQRACDRFHGICLTDLRDIKNLIDTISSNVDIAAASGGTERAHVAQVRDARATSLAGHFVSSRLEAATGMEGAASVVDATPDAINKAVYGFTHPQTSGSPTSQLPTAPTQPKKPKTHKFKPSVDPSTVALSVLNGTTKAGEAATTARRSASSATRPRRANAPRRATPRAGSTTRPGSQAAAADVSPHPRASGSRPAARRRPALASAETSSRCSAPTSAGSSRSRPPKNQQNVGAARSTISPDNQVYLPAFRNAAHRAPSRGSTRPSHSRARPRARSAGDADPGLRHPQRGPRRSTRSTRISRCRASPGASWGIEETGFADAPILANPSDHADARRPRLPLLLQRPPHPLSRSSYTAPRLLGQNTLLDDLSNADMIAIAKLAPAGRMTAAREHAARRCRSVSATSAS